MPSSYAKIYDFNGNVLQNVEYSVESVETGVAGQKPSVAHVIFIIDRSGSMYGSIEELKNTLLKVLAVLEYSAPDTLVSILSYSSMGDVTAHCSRMNVTDLCKADSKQLQSVKKIRATCLTGMSQAMSLASDLVHDGEITGIILHSDGYANDPSPSMEYRSMDAICAKLASKNVFVNTVAHSDYSDFQFLSKIASSVSGTCVKAVSTKEVYDAIEGSCTLLVSGTGTPIELKANGYDTVIFVNEDGKKIVGADGDLTVRGAGKGKCYAFRIRKVDSIPAEHEKIASLPNTSLMSALAKYLVGKGRLNEAKYAMLSTGVKDVYEKHYKALSANQIAAMCADLDDLLFNSTITRMGVTNPKIGGGISVLDAVKAISENLAHISLHLPSFTKSYSRKSVKKLAGKRLEDGSVEEPKVDTEYISSSDYVAIGSFDINRSDATINMLIPQKIRLVDRKSRKEISTVSGIRLDLTDYKKYTIVSNGEVSVDNLKIRIASKKAFDAMKAAGLFAADCDFSSETDYNIALSAMPVCSFGKNVAALPDFNELANLSLVSKFLGYVTTGKSSTYDASQIEALAAHCLSPNLYVSMPTTVPYTDLQQAMADGEIDSRTVFSVDIGSTEILNTGKFKSMKECLEKRYVVTKTPDGADGMADTWLKGAEYGRKTLSARSKTTKADMLQEALYDELLGVVSATPVLSGMESKYGIKGLVDAIKSRNQDELVKVAKSVSKAENALWRDAVSPFVFYVGSTGLMPDGVEVEMVASSDDLEKRFPELSLAKKEREEGTFFVVGKTHIVSMYMKSKYFSTEKGLEKIKMMKVASVEED